MNNQITSAQAIAANQFSLSNVYGGVAKFIQLAPTETAKSLGMTKKDFGTLAYEMHKKHTDRLRAKDEAKRAVSVAGRMKNRIEIRLSNKLEAGFPYRQPSSDWVDVNNKVAVEVTTVFHERIRDEAKGVYVLTPFRLAESTFEVSSQTVWHPKKSWKANQTIHTLYLLPSDTFSLSGGLLTIYKKSDVNKSVIPCKWYEQSRGFEVVEKSGFLVSDYHVEAATEGDAQAVTAKRIKRAKEARKVQDALKEKRDDAVLTSALVARTFGFCKAGIRSFCEANGLDEKGSYTLKQLRDVVVANRELNCRAYQPYLNKMGVNLNCK